MNHTFHNAFINTPQRILSYRKALKVPELKQILTRAGVPIPTKANKADLIAKIISEPNATAIANGEDPSSANGHASPVVATPSEPQSAVSNSTSDQKLKELVCLYLSLSTVCFSDADLYFHGIPACSTRRVCVSLWISLPISII